MDSASSAERQEEKRPRIMAGRVGRKSAGEVLRVRG